MKKRVIIFLVALLALSMTLGGCTQALLGGDSSRSSKTERDDDDDDDDDDADRKSSKKKKKEEAKSIFEATGTEKWAKNFDSKTWDNLTIYTEQDGRSQAPIAIGNTEKIEEVFESLSNVKVSGEGDLDEDALTNTLTFSDGTDSQSFVFQGGCVLIDGDAYQCKNLSDLLDSVEKEESGTSVEMLGEDVEVGMHVADTEVQDGEELETSEATDGYICFENETIGFSFLFDAKYPVATFDYAKGGISVYTETEGDYPCYTVFGLRESEEPSDNYLADQILWLNNFYGPDGMVTDDTLRPRDLQVKEYELGGENVRGIVYCYTAEDGSTLGVSSFVKPMGDIYAVVTGFYREDSQKGIAEGLGLAVASLQPDAYYYRPDGQRPSGGTNSGSGGTSGGSGGGSDALTLEVPNLGNISQFDNEIGFCSFSYPSEMTVLTENSPESWFLFEENGEVVVQLTVWCQDYSQGAEDYLRSYGTAHEKNQGNVVSWTDPQQMKIDTEWTTSTENLYVMAEELNVAGSERDVMRFAGDTGMGYIMVAELYTMKPIGTISSDVMEQANRALAVFVYTVK